MLQSQSHRRWRTVQQGVQAVPKTKQDEELKHLVLNFYRDELRDRYDLDNIRRFDVFSAVREDQLIALRDFFLEQIYPPPQHRQELDEAFDRLGEMLRSPMRMKPLVGATIRSMWRMGTRLPSAINAGRSTIDAYSKTRQLEGMMVKEAVKHEITPADAKKRERMLKLLNNVPESVVTKLIHDILNLFHALTNVEMLQVAADFMSQCVTVMEDRTDLYSDDDRAGIQLGLTLLQEGLALFKDMDPAIFPQVIQGIQMVEMDWFKRVQAEAAL